MLLSSLLLIPLIGVILISSNIVYLDKNAESTSLASSSHMNSFLSTPSGIHHATSYSYKIIALVTSIINLAISLVIFILFDFSNNQYQFVQEHYDMNIFDVYLGIDGISIYFVLLTTIIMPIAILSN
jgi:NADH-ubiquinone oxidoreductase chain 4